MLLLTLLYSLTFFYIVPYIYNFSHITQQNFPSYFLTLAVMPFFLCYISPNTHFPQYMVDGGKAEGRVWSQISLFFKWRVRGSCLKLIEQEIEFQGY